MGQFRRPNKGVGSHPFRMNKQLPTADIELFKDLFGESVQLYGDPIIYIQKEYAEAENTFGEHLIQTMTDVHEMYAFVEQTEGWEGMGDMFSKFGLRNQEEMTLHIPKNSFYDLDFKPKIGDIIYHVTSKMMWEIEDPKDDVEYGFHPLGQHVAFILGCKAYRFDHIEASEEFQQSENEHIQAINDVLFGDGSEIENAHEFEIEQKNDKLDVQITDQDIVDDDETDPLGF